MKKSSSKIIYINGAAVILLAAAFLTFHYWLWQSRYSDRIYPGINVAGINIGGLSREEALSALRARSEAVEAAGLAFSSNGTRALLETDITASEADLVFPVLVFENERTIQMAWGEESERGFLSFLKSRLEHKKNKALKPSYLLDEDIVRRFLDDSFPALNIAPQEARLEANDDADVEIIPEQLGKEINYDDALAGIKSQLDLLRPVEISVKTRTAYPLVRAEDLRALEPQAKAWLERGDFSLLLYDQKKSTSSVYRKVNPQQFIAWAKPKKNGPGVELELDSEKIEAYLNEHLSPALDEEVVLPRFEINNGRVTTWQAGKSGRGMDKETTARAIIAAFSAGDDAALIEMTEISPDQLTADNELNIKEILGTGHSRFAGSPHNRRHNIRIGADSLHGLLIRPGEEFSLIKALGNIDAASGYLPELVIKGNRTVPEYGGGLCQIGTTVFRTALATGLPITERRNHSYRVSYYEPAGTDATIYDPKPDFRFVNDTGNYILIQARIEGDDIYFDFWGVKDGRIATTTDPVIYNIVKPAPTKIIETTDLAPGERKCTEKSHDGADAYFDYKVIYPEGSTTTRVHERRFTSHYIPWQAVCLVGKAAPAPAPAPEAPAPGGDNEPEPSAPPAEAPNE